jgi:signal transduction histidine kinase
VAIDNARLYEAALAGSKAKSDFLAVMSHELRTPLSAVTGYADLLEAEITGPLTEKQKAQLRLIKLRAQDLLRIIEEVLAFSRMETGRTRIRLERVDLTSLVREVLVVARPLAEEKGLDLLVHLPADPIEVETDQDKVRHILLDLLSNAVKFTERGEIEFAAGTENRSLFFRVRDTGIGIRPEYHEKIFQPFFQLEEALTRKAGGTGLGLAVARRLARLLGGDITLKSAPGKGSDFVVRLPAPPA